MPTLAAVFIAAMMLSTTGSAQESPRYEGPIIDMHMHAFPLSLGPDGKPPPADCYGDPCEPIHTAARSDDDLLRMTVAAMERHKIVLGFLSGEIDMVAKWTGEAPGRFIASPLLRQPGELGVAYLREEYATGRFSCNG